jgi:hypothetical protein
MERFEHVGEVHQTAADAAVLWDGEKRMFIQTVIGYTENVKLFPYNTNPNFDITREENEIE